MAQLNRRSTVTATSKSKAKAIAAKENSRAMAMHALLITATLLGGLLIITQITH